MRVLRRSLSAPALALCLGACDFVLHPVVPPPVVQVTTDRSAYTRGEEGQVTIANLSDDPVQYNLCRREVERREVAGWNVVWTDPPVGSECGSEAYLLPPGGSLLVGMALPADLAPGTYRMRFLWLSADGSDALPSTQRTTNSFEILP